MLSKKRTLKIILWSARVLATLALAVLLFMLFGDLFSMDALAKSMTSLPEILTFVCFPISIIIGLLLAYKWKGLGGSISVIGMIGLHILRNDLITSVAINAFAIPGLLYVIYSVWSKN